MSGIMLDVDTANNIALLSMEDWRSYLIKEQEWFEADEDQRPVVEEKYGFKMWVHPDDYLLNKKYIAALNLIINAYGGSDE